VFVLNTAYEGLSHQLLEVMAIGTPIITTPVGGNPELITDGKEGLLVPVDDVPAYEQAVTKLLADTALMQSLAANARARAATFSSTDAVSGIAEVLKTKL
jgi:glycosyltransferase involved in cell wall biosynthesis